MQRVEVDRVKRYRCTYFRNRGGGPRLSVSVVPGPLQVVRKAIPLAIVATLFFVGWLDVVPSLVFGLLFANRFTDVFRECWLPEFAPGILNESSSFWFGECEIEFEAIAGPRTGFDTYDRRAVIVRLASGLPAELCVDNNDGDAALLNKPDN